MINMGFVTAFQPRKFGTPHGNRNHVTINPTKLNAFRASLSSKVQNSKSTFEIDTFSKLLYDSQRLLCSQIEEIDGHAKFCLNPWNSDTGEGKTRGKFSILAELTHHANIQYSVLQQGKVFEKAGVNVSVVKGNLSRQRAEAMTSQGRNVSPGATYHAAALSFVLHAQSPFLPTLRGDVRVFVSGGSFWGGGGVDLTIFYVDRPQISRFHQFWRRVCDSFDPQLYPQFKKQCDDYFYIPARGEYRGVGGLFYDDVPLPEDQLIQFQGELLRQFLNSYRPILKSQQGRPWTEDEKRWQRIRRGRYLEFNLLNDRGVRFGLAGATLHMDHIDDSAARAKVARTDSIMISAPPSIEWPFGFAPQPGSPEEETLRLLQGKPLDWVNMPVS